MLNQEEKTILEAAREAGEVVRHYFGQKLDTHRKTIKADFYTKADTEAEKAVLDKLKDFKDCNIKAEESGEVNNHCSRTLVIDPLDGTNNFALGFPYFSVGIALRDKDETVFSAVYHPLLDEMYYAKKGAGAFKNEKPLQVRQVDDLADITLAYTSGYSNIQMLRTGLEYELYQNDIKRFMDNWCPTLDYCLLAAGSIDAVIANDDDTGESSIGMLLIKEAGGYILDFAGNKSDDTDAPHFIAAGRQEVAERLADIVAKARRT